MKSVQVQKTSNEVQKNVFPVNRYIQTLGTEGSSSPSKATLAKVSFIVSCRFPAPLCDPG